jgi:hypothetical protein
MSQTCHERKSGAHYSITSSASAQEGRGHDDAERFRGLEVDDKRKPARLLDGGLPGLAPFKFFAAQMRA